MSQQKLDENAEKETKEKDNVSVKCGWEEAEHDVPHLPTINVERDLIIAKAYLQKISCRNETVWDHLNDILNHVLKERPPDCMRYFEELSRELRIKKFFLNKYCDDHYKQPKEENRDFDDSRESLQFYRRVECFYESDTPFDDKFGNMDFLPMFRLLNEAGIGFSYTDIYNLQMAMRVLPKVFPIERFKLWGKVFGTLRDYIIVEAELTSQAMEQKKKMLKDKKIENEQLLTKNELDLSQSEHPFESAFYQLEDETEENMKEDIEEETPNVMKRKLDTYVQPPVPMPVSHEAVEVPPEEPGQGLNRYVYYVINHTTDEWEQLPDVTPLQIVKGRLITRYLTGVLTNEVPGYPPFPGTEREYLRVQIARITATTHASPLGFYSSSGGEEEAIEMEEGQLYAENVDYQPLPLKDLLDPTLEFWVHHEPYILKQGRVEFWKPHSDVTEEEQEYETMSEVSGSERGPPILTSLSSDVMPDNTPAWTVRRASTLLNEESVVILRSNQWPGAITAIRERLLVNFYIGWGNKCFLQRFSPQRELKVEKEFEIGPEIMEMTDPTAEMEETRWMQLHPAPIVNDVHIEEGEEDYEQEEEEGDM